MRLAEAWRDEIAANAREAVNAVREKRAEFGTNDDLGKCRMTITIPFYTGNAVEGAVVCRCGRSIIVTLNDK